MTFTAPEVILFSGDVERALRTGLPHGPCGLVRTDPGTGEVIGSVYIRPSDRDGYDADVRSWVRADRTEMDKALHDQVTRWLADVWPFRKPNYAAR